ncbi:sulfatase [Cytophagaceae bacterium YF14B1]|uniref:Sulfatase n=1 Tax=Xanthocytophaga flava TaxID=3048013 RepID=A0AAE3QJH8_9BACT|nr:sulfatase [Xanthocytophaga flavus]MDJ1479781.1 sulfatase [Xanthocytophaga flavus]
MKISYFVGRVLGLVTLLISCNVFAQQGKKSGKLNVLLIYADDYNTKSGYNGHPIVQTPNLDKLAARSVNFKNAYCQYPLCSPSRTSLLSGKRPATTGIRDNNTPPRTHLQSTVFLPQLFKQNGYYTAQIGKIFHSQRFVKDGVPQGDFNIDTASWSFQYNELVDVKDPEVIRLAHDPKTSPARSANQEWAILNVADEQTGDGLVATKALAILEQRVKSNTPFFIATGFRRPHAPYDVPKKYFDLYNNASIKVPTSPANDLDDIPPIALTKIDPLTDQETIDKIKGYYASISFMDAQVGKLLQKLDEYKLWDNTIVIFLGDHGYHNGEHRGLWHKQTQFEEATHGNLLLYTPQAVKGKEAKGFIEYVDVYPTIAELAGLKAPSDLEGKSFVPLLNAPEKKWKQAVFSEVVHEGVLGKSVRTEQYRYTEWGTDKVELYDLQKDPNEFTNLAGKSAYSTIQQQLKQTLDKGWKTVKLISANTR